MNPFIAFTALSAVSSVSKGMAERAQHMNNAAQQELQAYLADTQTLQRDSINRDELTRFLSTVRAARSANGLSSSSPNAILLETEAVKASDRDRLIQKSDDKQRAANFRAAAKSSRSSARMSLINGFIGAAIPLAQYGMNRSTI